jgi:hypothetical protein
MRLIKVRPLELIMYLSIPSAIFYFLPYTESFFFLSSTLLLVGLKNENNKMLYLGLFLCSITRPAFTVIIPALVLMELISDSTSREKIRNILKYFLVTSIGILFVAFLQFKDTGKWFEFFSVQDGWGNHLQMPKLPLTSWGGNMIVRLDGISLLFGLFAGIFLLIYIFKLFNFRRFVVPKEVILSLAYLGGMTLIVLLFRGGSLFSLNRFLMATPFIIVAVNYYLNSLFSVSKKQLIVVFFGIILYWLLFGSYVHIQAFLKYTLVSGYFLLFLILKFENEKVSKIAWFSFIGLNFIFQLFFYSHFLVTKGEIGWVG